MPGISGDKCVIYVISVKSSYGEKYFFPDKFYFFLGKHFDFFDRYDILTVNAEKIFFGQNFLNRFHVRSGQYVSPVFPENFSIVFHRFDI